MKFAQIQIFRRKKRFGIKKTKSGFSRRNPVFSMESGVLLHGNVVFDWKCYKTVEKLYILIELYLYFCILQFTMYIKYITHKLFIKMHTIIQTYLCHMKSHTKCLKTIDCNNTSIFKIHIP